MIILLLNCLVLLMVLYCFFLIILVRKGGKLKVNLGLFRKVLDLLFCCLGMFSIRWLWLLVLGWGVVVWLNMLVVYEIGKCFVEYIIILLMNFIFLLIKLLNSLGRKVWEVDIVFVINMGFGFFLEYFRYEWYDNYLFLNFLLFFWGVFCCLLRY